MAMTWQERAKTAGRFTLDDEDAAGDWDRCAVGEWTASTPADRRLGRLGLDFENAVRRATADSIQEAFRVYDQIKRRAIKLGFRRKEG